MIYYVEDDDNIRELVVYTLNQTGLDAMGFADAGSFYAACEQALPKLVLLDVMLPNEDGLSILTRLRAAEKTRALPVMMVTAKGAEYDKVLGLDKGADDYITKPFGMAELVARVKALLRRAAPKENAALLSSNGLTLDKTAYTVTVESAPVALTRKEFELLAYLMENRGAVISREKLLEAIWDYAYEGGTRTVDVHVQTLRSKLGSCGTLIETVRGIGYRFGGIIQ
ncbi:MAG: response regulator transcription factor [Clostridia bacterium]|nr:response regulator transcription factor [Clostridia bacterium]